MWKFGEKNVVSVDKAGKRRRMENYRAAHKIFYLRGQGYFLPQ